jgi:nicotinamide mononucleotide transporter
MPVSAWEIAGVVFGIASVWLIVKESVLGWPTGLVNVGLFIVVFWKARLYADMGLQVVYVVLCLYGWWAWRHGGKLDGSLSVTRTPRRALWLLGAGGAAGAGILGLVLHGQTDASLPFWDSTTTSFSLVAQWMQTRKWLENWWVWIAVDAVYIGIYMAKHLFLTAGLYAIFLGLAIQGVRSWRRSLTPGADG